MTWQRRHCVECWHDMEHCATCGCHDTADDPDDCANLALNSTSGEERPRSAGTLGARPATDLKNGE